MMAFNVLRLIARSALRSELHWPRDKWVDTRWKHCTSGRFVNCECVRSVVRDAVLVGGGAGRLLASRAPAFFGERYKRGLGP